MARRRSSKRTSAVRVEVGRQVDLRPVWDAKDKLETVIQATFPGVFLDIGTGKGRLILSGPIVSGGRGSRSADIKDAKRVCYLPKGIKCREQIFDALIKLGELVNCLRANSQIFDPKNQADQAMLFKRAQSMRGKSGFGEIMMIMGGGSPMMMM